MKRLPQIWLLLFLLMLLAGSGTTQSTQWNGYVQWRYHTNWDQSNGFSIRRAKAWIKGHVSNLSNLKFKVQAIFRPQNKGALVLQDAYGEYRWTGFSLRVGQMVPAFSLQRYQPDYRIPLVERAQVIKALIPSAETGARDIGMQLHWALSRNRLEVFGGIFNGNGGNQLKNEDTHFLLTYRSIWHLVNTNASQAQLGASFAYRKTSGMVFKKILGPEVIFRGRDARFGLEGRLQVKQFLLQGEWIQARLGEDRAVGYYLLASLLAASQHQWTFSIERYRDAIDQTDDPYWFILGYAYRWRQDKAKLMVDSRIRKDKDAWHPQITIQLQWFFN